MIKSNGSVLDGFTLPVSPGDEDVLGAYTKHTRMVICHRPEGQGTCVSLNCLGGSLNKREM